MIFDEFNLFRFVDAQKNVFDEALAELKAGRKRTHWMWFIFPQLRGLGSSAMAEFYGVTSIQEARAYLQHETLRTNLIATTEAVLHLQSGTLTDILGLPDDLKFISSMTLFDIASGGRETPYRAALIKWNKGGHDQRTLDALHYASDNYPSLRHGEH